MFGKEIFDESNPLDALKKYARSSWLECADDMESNAEYNDEPLTVDNVVDFVMDRCADKFPQNSVIGGYFWSNRELVRNTFLKQFAHEV